MIFRLNESVKKLDDCYFTYSYSDLGSILRNPGMTGKVVRLLGIANEELFCVAHADSYKIHYDILDIAKSSGIVDANVEDYTDAIHLYSIHDTNIQQKLRDAEFEIDNGEYTDELDDYTSLVGQSTQYQINNKGDLLLGWYLINNNTTVDNMINKLLKI